MKEYVDIKYCPQCGSENINSVKNINAIWRALPVFKCECCSLRFSVRKHNTDIDVDSD